MITIRTEPVKVGTQPYDWNTDTKYQCTWYCYYRALEVGFTPPTYWDRITKVGSYPNAKEWLTNYREPWEVKGIDYQAKAGDIAVFDGNYGHVQFMETDTMFSEYSSGNVDSFKNGKFVKKSNLLGFLHFPHESLSPVERNIEVDQIQTTDESLRIRSKPNLNGEIVGHVQLGYYNVLSTKEADNYTWYQLAKDRWCADISTIYLPAEDDIIKELDRLFKSMKRSLEEKQEVIEKQNERLRKIHELSEVD